VRIFLDANILFSAAKSDGAVRQLVRLMMDAGHECWIDPYVEAEARRNLEAKAPEFVVVLERLLADCHSAPFRPITPEISQTLVALPEKDRPVLAAAIRLGCDVLVTGDRTHFGALFGSRLQGVEIHSPATLAALLLRRAR
jgi:predicted nucleic acid-binding protein